MTRKEFDSLYLGKAVHCKGETFDKSKELARKFLLLADSVGYEWWGNSNKSLKNCLLWSFGEDTVYYVEETISQGIIDSCKNSHNFEIVEFKSAKSNNDDLVDAFGYCINGIVDETRKRREMRAKQREQFFTGKTMTIPQMQHTLPHIKIVRREEKTLLEKILEEVGITIGVEFNIKYTEANCAPKNKFRYEKNVGAQQLINGKWVDAHWLWYKLISGKAKVVKTPLLTDAEREFLKNFEFEELIKDNANIALRKKDRLISLHIIELKYCKYKFNGLEDYKPFIKDSKTYTRDELGL